jgi:hypothetical protein
MFFENFKKIKSSSAPTAVKTMRHMKKNFQDQKFGTKSEVSNDVTVMRKKKSFLVILDL